MTSVGARARSLYVAETTASTGRGSREGGYTCGKVVCLGREQRVHKGLLGLDERGRADF